MAWCLIKAQGHLYLYLTFDYIAKPMSNEHRGK
jgi:hypothetical protein